MNRAMLKSGQLNMNKGTSPPLGRGGCAPKKMVPFLSGADGEGRRLFQVGSVSDLPGRAAFSVALQGYAARPPLLEEGMCPCSCLSGLLQHSPYLRFN